MPKTDYDKIYEEMRERQRKSQELQEKIAKKLKQVETRESVPEEKRGNVEKLKEGFESDKNSRQNIDDIIGNTNSKVLLEVLSPEVSRNEDKKRTV